MVSSSSSSLLRSNSRNVKVCLLLSAFMLLSFGAVVFGKEIVATREWQVIGANDTVAAGMHIRMDLTTGERMVKLPEKDGDDAEILHADSKSALATISSSSSEKTTTQTQPQLDFEMMHRTFSSLPEDEQLRMGGIPQLVPKKTTPTTTPKASIMSEDARKIFEARMTELWNQRQAEIRAIEVADLPELLKIRISQIQEYLSDPRFHLRNYLINSKQKNSNDHDKVNDIIDVLEDLEFQLMDIDMAKDFHTLGGWPLLVTLITDQAHELAIANTTTSSPTISDIRNDIDNLIRVVQARAAWALGTAAKNTADFNAWATEPLRLPLTTSANADTTITTTALEVVLDQLVDTVAVVVDPINNNHDDSVTEALHQTTTKLLYALGSLLRGNRLAQVHFLHLRGPSKLHSRFFDDDDNNNSAKAELSSQKKKKLLSMRVLKLAQDIVSEIDWETPHKEQLAVGKAIVRNFAVFCDAIMEQVVAESPGAATDIDNNALEFIAAFAPHCPSWSKQTRSQLVASIQKVRRERALENNKASSSGGFSDNHHDGNEDEEVEIDYDSELKADHLEKLDYALAALQQQPEEMGTRTEL